MPQPSPEHFILQTQQAKAMLAEGDCLPIFVGSKEAFVQAHIPGSVHLAPQQLVCGHPPAAGKIPDADDLAHTLSSIGLRNNQPVIAYDDEGGGWAGRLVWTLDVINHSPAYFLDGGINAWLADGLPSGQGDYTATASNYSVAIDSQQLVSVEALLGKIGSADFAIWDARSVQEYLGEKVVAARGGHIPGAANLDWLELMDRSNHLRLKPLDKIRQRLAGLGIDDSQQIVTHCQSHHRSGLSYIVGKALGLDIRAYDGSWSEWGNLPDTPVETADENPARAST